MFTAIVILFGVVLIVLTMLVASDYRCANRDSVLRSQKVPSLPGLALIFDYRGC